LAIRAAILQSRLREEQDALSWHYLAVATEAVLRAGALQKARYGQELDIRFKGEIDLVTDVDRACEDAILDTIRTRFPDHDIVTEETKLARAGSRFLWFIDPLDGTVNFAHGYPFFCASVALAVDREVVAGAVFDPIKQELFTAERGAGAHLNGRRLRVTATSTLLRGLLVTGFPYDVRDDVEGKVLLFKRFLGQAQAIRRDGSAALDLCYLAAGRIDGFWEERLNSWDMMAGKVMVEEAGGRVSRFDGSPLGIIDGEIVASNGALHPALLDVLRQEREESAAKREKL
jgi:myo-inositol-1(or 4)-monophosphatase